MRKLPVVPICRRASPLRKIRINATSSAIPPRQEGRTRRHEREAGMRWTWIVSLDVAIRDADGKVVWSWRPWAGAKLCGMACEATVTKRSWTPGRARTSQLTPSRREGRVAPVEPVVSTLVCFFHCTRGRGCNQHPVFPAPSAFEGQLRCKTRAIYRGNAQPCLGDCTSRIRKLSCRAGQSNGAA